MRITFTLDDEVVRLVEAYAGTRSLAVGKALSELVRRGLGPSPKTRVVNGLGVFDVPEGSETVSSEQVKRICDA